ncbi:hypothetical protein [Janibacter limosus]|uniref:Uncharacterized protein n=1 Tax=Janibacter limosus TaxID=53458 RepID=A0A4P6MZ97_9MICO|nr:hypothetical protein [Janibacter limosus]QBF47637.1 hypothetical protein EXU32_16115 [Janibacter limosus]
MSNSNFPQPEWTQDSDVSIRVGREEVAVKRLAPEPATYAPLARHEAQFLRSFDRAEAAGLISNAPPEGMVRAFARSIAEDPKRVVDRLETGITMLSTDIADVSVLRTVFSCFAVLPGDQPRGAASGGRPTQAPDPIEDSDAAEDHLGLRTLVFEDLEHLRRWCADSIGRSLVRAKKRGRPLEIAATGTRRPISVSMVRVQFEDGTPEQWVPMASDGISRLSVCLAGVLDLVDKDTTVAAKSIVETLIPTNVLTASSRSNDLVRRMQRQHHKHVEVYEGRVTEDGPDERAISIRQFLSLPADVYLLATHTESGEPHAMESAMQGVVSDTHTGVDGWAPEDQARHTVVRALTKMLDNGDITDAFHGLCTGRVDPEVVDEQIHPSHDDVDNSKVLLRRAVSIMAVLGSQTTYDVLKRNLREFGGHQRLTLNQVVEYIAPLVCEPWGTDKPMTKAWNYGGPVLPELRSAVLEPTHPADYLDLVELIFDKDADEDEVEAAALELALAGGTALLADGVLTTAVVGGSGGSKSKLDYRGAINTTIGSLTATEEGLTLLAIAANTFKPAQKAEKSRLPALDMAREDRIQRDKAKAVVGVTEKQIATLAAQGDPGRATNKDSENEEPGDGGQTEEELLLDLASALPDAAQDLLKDVEEVRRLHDRVGATTGLSEEDIDAFHDALMQANKLIGKLQ